MDRTNFIEFYQIHNLSNLISYSFSRLRDKKEISMFKIKIRMTESWIYIHHSDFQYLYRKCYYLNVELKFFMIYIYRIV